MKCSCGDWKENIKILNSSIVLYSDHGFGGLKKPFIYCPYCARNLEEEIINTQKLKGGIK